MCSVCMHFSPMRCCLISEGNDGEVKGRVLLPVIIFLPATKPQLPQVSEPQVPGDFQTSPDSSGEKNRHSTRWHFTQLTQSTGSHLLAVMDIVLTKWVTGETASFSMQSLSRYQIKWQLTGFPLRPENARG